MHITDLIGEELSALFKDRINSLPQYYFYDLNAAQSLATVLRDEIKGPSVLLFSDKRTRSAAGGPLLTALKAVGLEIGEVSVPDEKDGASPRCDDVTREALSALIPEADIYIALGSGVVNDLTKWIAGEMNKPYAVYATAASMNGYASANVAPAIKGVKALFTAKAPYAIAADPSIIEKAGLYLTAAGLGDLIAKPVSTADWLLNHLLFEEEFSGPIAKIITAVEPSYLEQPQAIAKGDRKAVGDLFKALVLSGCAMTLQGSSLPASGGEHLISHALDMKAYIENEEHDLHGRQVGVATLFVAALYQRIVALERPVFHACPLSLNNRYWGGLINAVQEQHAKACAKTEKAAAILNRKGAWEDIKKKLISILRSPEVIKTCLKSAGAAHCLEDIGCTKEDFYMAVSNCASIRERFTSIDLGFSAGLLPDAIEEIIDEWLI